MYGKNFCALWRSALSADDREGYVRMWSDSPMWGNPENCSRREAVNDAVGHIWDVAHMNVKAICKVTGMTQAALAQRFCINKRTVESWCGSQTRECPDHVRLLMAEALGILDRAELNTLMEMK